MGQQTKARTGTTVRFRQEREFPIAENVATAMRLAAITQTDELKTQLDTLWNEMNLNGTGDDAVTLTTEQREQFGAVLWICGEMRDRISNLLYLTEEHHGIGLPEGSSSRVGGTPADHDFAGEPR